MYRVNIVYEGGPEETFEWTHYLSNHLPLACGVSSRHAPIIYCDVDQPLAEGAGSKIRCICTVYFADGETQNRFRAFFADAHPDSLEIISDQPNYTAIEPAFNAGDFVTDTSSPVTAKYRVRVLFSEATGSPDSLSEAKSLLTEKMGNILGVEVDYCRADVTENSKPKFSEIWSYYFDEFEPAYFSGEFQKRFNGNVQVCISNLINFDMKLAEKYFR